MKDGLRISMVVAAAENNAIGKQNGMLWHLPADFRFFKNMTWGMPMLMGRKTFESLLKITGMLHGRFIMVLTRNAEWKHDGVKVVRTLDEAKQLAIDNGYAELMIAGGAEIYRQAMPAADRVYLTRVQASFEADAFFPELDDSWKLVSSRLVAPDQHHAYGMDFQTWERRPG